MIRVRRARHLRKYKPKYPLMETALLNYLKETRKGGCSVNGTMLKRKAMSLYQEIYQDEAFSASKGFIWKFMQRNRLTTRTVTVVARVNILAKSDPHGGNKFNLEKNREEIQLKKNSDNLSTFL